MLPPAHGNGEVKDGQHVGPFLLDEQISDDGGSDCGITGLPDTHQAPSQQQGPEILKNKIILLLQITFIY